MNEQPFPPLRRDCLRFRAATFVWAVLFLLAGAGNAFSSPGCGHHDTAATEHAVAHRVVPADAADHHADHHRAVAGEIPAPEHEEHADACTCLGACQAGATAPLAADTHVSLSSLSGPADKQSTRFAAHTLPGQPSHLLPYATAPPAGY